MRNFDEKFINAYVKMKATEDNENVSLDERLSAMEYCFAGSKDGSKVVEFERLMLNDTKLRRGVYIKIREEKRKLESANEDKITEQPLTNNSAASKNPYAPYSLQEAAELYDGLKEALEIDKEFVTKLYNSSYKLSKYSYNNESTLEQLNEAAWMHQANPEFVDSFLEKNKIQLSEFYRVSDVIGQALNLGDEDRQCFEKLAANIDIKEFCYRFQDEENGNLQELVKIARHDFKMTAALLKFGARDFTNDDINKAVYSDYKNKASIYRLIKVFDENVNKKYNNYLITAVTKFSVEEREKMVKNVAAYKGKDLKDYLSKNEKLIMMKNNKEQYREKLIQEEEKQKQEGLEARRKEMKEEELDRRINKIADRRCEKTEAISDYRWSIYNSDPNTYGEWRTRAFREEREQKNREFDKRRKEEKLDAFIAMQKRREKRRYGLF